tara:strand:+ start:66 stop:593 length:528 start_codon:yes stop_codon:yes gene_type:complete
MKKVYDIWVDLSKGLITVKAENLTEALQETKKELNKMIDSISEQDLKKEIDTDRGLYYYQFQERKKDTYDNTDIVIYDSLDYSYVDGKKYGDFSGYDLFHWESPELEHLVTHGVCWCCDHILPKKDIKDNIEKICKKKNLNYDYIEDVTPICNKCITDEAYMGEYNRTKEIYEEV